MNENTNLSDNLLHAHLMIPDVFSWTGMIGAPVSSSAGVMSKTARDMAIHMNKDASARCIPAQIRRA